MINYVKRNDIFSDFRRGLRNSEIARNHNCSRTTIVGLRKLYSSTVADKEHPEALEELLQSTPKYKGRKVDNPVLTDEIKRIIDADLNANAVKAATGLKKQQKKATDIHVDLCRAGYSVSYRTVVRYIKAKKSKAEASVFDCFIKQKYVPGERMEFDWGEVRIYIKGRLCSFNMAAIALCSNGRWGRLFTRQDKQAMMEAHVEGLKFWGHVPGRMVYDNMRTAVKSFTGGEKTPTLELTQLEGYYGFKHQFCNIRSGNEKGHVERAVEILRRIAFSRRDHFNSLEEANEYLLSICQENNEALKTSIQEELDLMQPTAGEMACFEADYRHADKLATISLDTIHYSVPFEYVERNVWVKKYSDKVVIFNIDGPSKVEIARHERSHTSDDWVLDLQHYLKVLKVKPGALHNSMALRQTPQALQDLFDTYFSDNARGFIELLLWAKENAYSYQDLYSSVKVARMKGVGTITAESIKATLCESKSMVELLDLPWSKGIEDGAELNIASLGRLFNSYPKNTPS